VDEGNNSANLQLYVWQCVGGILYIPIVLLYEDRAVWRFKETVSGVRRGEEILG